LSRFDRDARIDDVGVVGCLDAAIDDLSLRMALLAPGFDRQTFGAQDRRRTCNFAGGEALLARIVHFVAPALRGRGLVNDGSFAEQEFRPRIDRDCHGRRIVEHRVRRKVRSLAAVDQDRDRAAISALGIKSCEQAPIISACLGKQATGARRRFIPIVPEGGRGSQPAFQPVFIVLHRKFGRVVLRFADNVDLGIVVRAEQAEKRRRLRCG
jgi:hypothetical protein